MKTETTYPPEFHLKVLAREAPGGAPHHLNAVIPSITRPGQPFAVRIAALDKTGYPALRCGQTARIFLPGQERGVVSLPFYSGKPAVGAIAGITLRQEGFFRIAIRLGKLRAWSNPTYCTAKRMPGIFWGDPHVHTILSRCFPRKCRTLNFCFTCARHVSALDWVSSADHVSNGRGDISKWREQSAAADLYTDEPSFITLPAYEASLKGGAGGDNNVYMARFPDMFADEFENGHAGTLARALGRKLPPHEFFLVPHHTTRTGKHGEISDEIYPGPRALPVLEIHSKWGTSEYRGNPNPLKEIHPGPSYAVDFLNRGLRLGFIAGTDSHATMPSGGGDEPGHIDRLPGLTAVFCPKLSRRAVFDSIRSRRCYAASLERIVLLGSIAGCAFGGETRLRDLRQPPAIRILAAAGSEITRIDLVRNGRTIHSTAPNRWQAEFYYEDCASLDEIKIRAPRHGAFIYYYIRLTCSSGAQAWSSPVWISA